MKKPLKITTFPTCLPIQGLADRLPIDQGSAKSRGEKTPLRKPGAKTKKLKHLKKSHKRKKIKIRQNRNRKPVKHQQREQKYWKEKFLSFESREKKRLVNLKIEDVQKSIPSYSIPNGQHPQHPTNHRLWLKKNFKLLRCSAQLRKCSSELGVQVFFEHGGVHFSARGQRFPKSFPPFRVFAIEGGFSASSNSEDSQLMAHSWQPTSCSESLAGREVFHHESCGPKHTAVPFWGWLPSYIGAFFIGCLDDHRGTGLLTHSRMCHVSLYSWNRSLLGGRPTPLC